MSNLLPMGAGTKEDWDEFLRLKAQAADPWIALPELEQVHARLKAVATGSVPQFLHDDEFHHLGEYLAARRRAAQLLEENGGQADKGFLCGALERYAHPEKFDLPVVDLFAYDYLLKANVRHPDIDKLLPMLDAGATIEQVIEAAQAYEPIRL